MKATKVVHFAAVKRRYDHCDFQNLIKEFHYCLRVNIGKCHIGGVTGGPPLSVLLRPHKQNVRHGMWGRATVSVARRSELRASHTARAVEPRCQASGYVFWISQKARRALICEGYDVTINLNRIVTINYSLATFLLFAFHLIQQTSSVFSHVSSFECFECFKQCDDLISVMQGMRTSPPYLTLQSLLLITVAG